MRYMLDSDTCIYAMNRTHGIREKLLACAPEDLSVSSVVVAEITFGVRTGGSLKSMARLERFLADLTIANFDRAAARAYAEVRLALERAGTPIGSEDTLIAAHAISLGLTVITHNTREFTRVKGLKVEDWTHRPAGSP